MNDKQKNPRLPQLALAFLRWFCKPEFLEDVEGDLNEYYAHQLKKYSPVKSRLKVAIQILKLFRPKIIKPLRIKTPVSGILIRNNLKMAWRHQNKHKSYSLINIGGLSLGMAVVMLIGLWLWDETSYDHYHKNYNRIARVIQNQTFDVIQTWQGQAKQLGPELRDNYGSNFKYITMASGFRNRTLNSGEKIMTRRGMYLEPEAPHMLTIEMVHGSRAGLQGMYSILISESTALAFFGHEDPINRLIKIENESELEITGVYKDIPNNSSFAGLDFIAPWKLYETFLPDWLGWGNSWFRTYVQINETANMQAVSESIKLAKWHNLDEADRRLKPELFLQPMREWRLYSDFKGGVSVGGRIEYVILFGIIGAFVLILACINFMNFSTARSEKRAKEVGIRKAIGSYRRNLIVQFLSESILTAFMAFLLSLLLTQMTLPFFNEVANKQATIPWTSINFWFLAIGFVFFTGILAGSYPALFLSSFNAAKVLKGGTLSAGHASLPRKVLVVFQITVSLTLIIGTIIVFRQIQFAKSRPIGYNQANLIGIPIKNDYSNDHFNTYREDLLGTGVVAEVSKSESPITQTWTTNSGLSWRGKDPDMPDEFVTVRITHEFGKTIGWEIIQGRDFSRQIAADSDAFVINEATVEYLGFEDPIGEIITWGDSENKHEIIGVVRNMITQNPYGATRQMFFFIDYSRSSYLNVKLNNGVATSDALAKVESVYKKYDPVNPFEFEFMDQDYATKFGDEVRIGKLSLFFTILAILISCLGLFGMASFVAEQRTKEIGIRKVLGASALSLWRLVSSEFLIMVIIACAIAIPVSYYLLENWLQSFEYRTGISVFVYLSASFGILMLTLVTVSYQSIRIALSNPVKSLKTD